MKIISILIVLLCMNMLYSDNIDNMMNEYKKSEKLPRLRDIYKDKFLIGGIIQREYKIPTWQGTWNSYHASTLTSGNDLKMDSMQKVEGKFNPELVQKYLDFCKKDNITLVGHALVWHVQYPKWFFNNDDGSQVDKKTLLKRIEDHIVGVMTPFKGKIKYWDVVNEAISKGTGTWRESPYYKIAGRDFFETAFRTAHRVDPDCKLIYNDYGMHSEGRQKVLREMLQWMKDKKIPIHGVGFQSHMGVNGDPLEGYRKGFKMVQEEFGLEVHVTELDISVHNGKSPQENVFPDLLPEPVEMKQALRYARLFQLYKEAGVKRVTFWGTSDEHSWKNSHPKIMVNGKKLVRRDHALLFDWNKKPKLAFWAVCDPDAFIKKYGHREKELYAMNSEFIDDGSFAEVNPGSNTDNTEIWSVDFENGKVPLRIKNYGGAKLGVKKIDERTVLEVSERKKPFDSFQIPLEPWQKSDKGLIISLDVYIKETSTVSLTVKTTENGKSKYNRVNRKQLQGGEWQKIMARIPQHMVGNKGAIVYLNCKEPQNLYVDNITIK